MPQRSRKGCKNWLAASMPSAMSLFFGHSALAQAKVAHLRPTGEYTTSSQATPQDGQPLPVKFDVETLVEGSVEYNTGTCALISSGKYSSTLEPTHGALSYGILKHAIQSGDKCNGKILPFAVVYYTWTDNQTTATQDPFSVEWKTPDGMIGGPYSYVAGLTTPVITSGIAFQGTNIANGPSQSVMSGQQIILTGYPAPSGQAPFWKVDGAPIGGFSVTPTSGTTADPSFNAQNTTFYWSAPSSGTYTVTYSPGSQGTQSTASFTVSGPTVSIVTQRGRIAVLGKPGNYRFSCGKAGETSTHCASFYMYTNDQGQFKWAQFLYKDTITTIDMSGNKNVDAIKPSLDLMYNLPTKIDCMGATDCVADAPDDPLCANLTYLERDFSARMYLMWNAQISENSQVTSIDIPLGSTPWSWHSSTRLENGVWSDPMPSLPYVGQFAASSKYPEWIRVAGQGPGCQ